MESILLEILNKIKAGEVLDHRAVEMIIRKHNKNLTNNNDHFSKKKLIPFYLEVKKSKPEQWASWDITPASEKLLLQALQIKPRRTASGVATITVLTKPWKCTSNCLYCPNDLTMPKSYLRDEPACQRAERNFFDPYLQVSARLQALTHMGHVTDKIELIILGGTWSDYPQTYQVWFITELFRALNDNHVELGVQQRHALYEQCGLSNSRSDAQDFVRLQQERVYEGTATYNQAWSELYENSPTWQQLAQHQSATLDDLEAQQVLNETATHRVVGLVVETRPDTITSESLMLLRRLGCTKVQMGIQSLNPALLKLNDRGVSVEKIREAFDLLRLFGFKIHIHFMVNLYGATPEEDKQDYLRLVTEPFYLPDEVKLYPCVLVQGTKLCQHFANQTWQPYGEEELIDILTADTLATPAYTRISRMIRDISAHDIVAGSKKINLRQLVEGRLKHTNAEVAEIRYREISTQETHVDSLKLSTLTYETNVAHEYFLQWVTPHNGIAGFLRLSLPKESFFDASPFPVPIQPHEAMIREVHVYGKVAKLHAEGDNAQHIGLGKRLIAQACAIAKEQGYTHLNVISAVGTREYYRRLGFFDTRLYQQKPLG